MTQLSEKKIYEDLPNTIKLISFFFPRRNSITRKRLSGEELLLSKGKERPGPTLVEESAENQNEFRPSRRPNLKLPGKKPKETRGETLLRSRDGETKEFGRSKCRKD